MLLDSGSWDGGTGATFDKRRQPKAVREGSPGGPRTRRTGALCANILEKLRHYPFRADPTPRYWQRRALKPHHLAARSELETSTNKKLRV